MHIPRYWYREAGEAMPPVRYPWESVEDEQSMRAWEIDYARAVREYATCQYLDSMGRPRIADELAPMVELHDRYTAADSGKPLA